jgi:hypothetical protein
VHGPDGTPLLSWRVLILPYIEEEQLFKEFKLDEPWDSPNNIRLLERMPRIYAPPRGKRSLVPPHHTVCQVFVGPGTAFEGPGGIPWKDFPDGQSNTFLIVEAGDPVPWTKPADIRYDPGQPVVLRGLFSDMFRAGMCDGSSRRVPYTTSEAQLRAAITRNGDEKVTLD